MLEEENSRLKRLLVATTITYVIGWVIGLTLGRFIYSESYIIWTIGRSWAFYITYFFIFLGFFWIPLSIFLLVQGLILKRKYSENLYLGDKTIGNLSVLTPVFFWAIYIFTRVLY
jgi:hypothetical protein